MPLHANKIYESMSPERSWVQWCQDDNDNIRPGRITMKPTIEQNALIAAAKVGIDLLLEDGIMKARKGFRAESWATR